MPQKPTFFIHQRLKQIRIARNLNQNEMATILGITQGWLSKLEAGIGDIPSQQLIALRDHFGVSIDLLLARHRSFP